MTSEPPWDSHPLSRVVSDPVALRALAHPLRVKLHGLVSREGSLTAADAARQLGISQALASHHLRQLAKYGFVEPADATDSRARPWRAVSASTFLRPEEAEGREASDLMQRWMLERTGQELIDWQQRRGELDERWTELTEVLNGLLYLTVEEMADFRQKLNDLLMPLAVRRPVGDHRSRPDEAEPVSFTIVTIPVQRTEHGG